MSVIIYGQRPYGRLPTHEGEYAHTVFAHIDFIPLFPVESFWITSELAPDERIGFPIKLHAKSVLATYLRFWAPAVAALVYLSWRSPVATALAIALAALSVWSWMWGPRRGARARRRSDFDRVALGSRCDPALMPDDMRRRLSRTLESQLAGLPDARPPDDVARFGARNFEEAILAYGLLRLNAVEHRAAAAAAERLLASTFDELPSEGGPYRERLAGSVPQLGAAISAAARAKAEARRAQIAAATAPRWAGWLWLKLVGLVCLTLLLVAPVISLFSLAVPHTADPHELAGTRSLTGRVTVRCDRVADGNWQVRDHDALVHRVDLCWLGDRVLPVVSRADEPIDSPTVRGELRWIVVSAPLGSWAEELRRHHVRAYDTYLDRDADSRTQIVAGIGFCLAIFVGWRLWIRAFRRHRRAAA
jgi:hypothetical protein